MAPVGPAPIDLAGQLLDGGRRHSQGFRRHRRGHGQRVRAVGRAYRLGWLAGGSGQHLAVSQLAGRIGLGRFAGRHGEPAAGQLREPARAAVNVLPTSVPVPLICHHQPRSHVQLAQGLDQSQRRQPRSGRPTATPAAGWCRPVPWAAGWPVPATPRRSRRSAAVQGGGLVTDHYRDDRGGGDQGGRCRYAARRMARRPVPLGRPADRQRGPGRGGARPVPARW